ncbi:DUF4405 domain-containing protein [Desulfobacter curvatus]|uniref:DUF4405 domain-containing protein n=1 Tax=Desulfobacter curvatus TaxID=2290 RepID=UPI0003606CA8|nr:DUF4405 domain-containing protein [Desulfobacter curvatus]
MIKKTTSLTLFSSGVVLLLSSVVLYLGPPSHVGHFSPWTFMGLNRHHWGAIHLNSGILFCIAMLVHTWYNWKPLASYMTFGIRPGKTLVPMLASLLLTLFVSTGSFHHAPPMKQVMGFARFLKTGLVKKYGTPPYGASTRFPASAIVGYMGLNLRDTLARLKENHIAVDSPGQSLAEIAEHNHTTIGCLLDIMHTTGDSHEKM